LACQAIEIGGTLPAVMNAADEIAVNAFLEGSLKFTPAAEGHGLCPWMNASRDFCREMSPRWGVK